MLKMVILTTDSNEVDLFLKLRGRGRHADIPYYQSVENFYPEKGEVTFRCLSYSPAQGYKVGVAGNRLITTESFQGEIRSWLIDWKIEFTSEEKEVASGEEAQKLFKRMRSETKQEREKRNLIEELRMKLRKQGEEMDKELLAMCSSGSLASSRAR